MTRNDLERLLDLPAPQRLQLAEVLFDSVVEADGEDLSAGERELVEARLAAYRSSTNELLDWSEIRRRAAR